MRPARAFLVLLATFLMATAAAGQNPSPTGNLYGTALDEQGKVLPGVTVTLTGPGAAQAAATDAQGDFRFLNLSPGAYAVTLERTGFATVRRDVTVALGKNAVFAVTLPVAGAAEAVTVSGEGLAADSRQTETGETFDRKELDTIPTTRDPWSVLRQVPGVLVANMNVNGGESAAQSTFVGKGAHADQNTYNLDGVAVTDMAAVGSTPLYFDFDSLQNIEVVTGGSDPALSTPGVTLNLVTRQGTNELKGSGRAYYFFPSSVGSLDQASSQGGWNYGLEAGGPLWKDHLWLWGAGARNDVPGQTFYLPDGDPVRQKTDLYDANAKLNAQLVPANTLTLFYLYFDKLTDGVNAGPNFSQPSTWNQTTPTSAYKVEDSQVLSQKIFASLYFSYLSGDFTLTPTGGLHQQADFDADYVWQNTYLFYESRRPQHQAGLTVSGFFDTGNLGHELKFGFGYKHAAVDSLSVWPGDQLVGSEPFGLASITRASHPKYETNYYDAYLGDTMRIGNLTVNAAVRFDYQQGRNLPSSVPPNPAFPELLPAVSYGGDSGYPITWRSVQPRVGATYALGQDRRTLLRASYATFANQLGSEIAHSNAFPGAAMLYYYWTDTNGNHRVEPNEVQLSQGLVYSVYVNPNDPGSDVPVNQVARNLKPARTDEFIIGVERQVLSGVSASVAYTHRSARDLEFPSIPAAAQPIVGVTRGDYRYVGNAIGVATASNGFTLSFSEPFYGLTSCPDPCAGIVIQNRPDYSMTYNGVELQVVKQLSDGWSLRAGFAYNDWTQSVGPGGIVNPNNLRGGTNASGAVVEPAGRYVDAGSFINSRWQFNVSGTVLLPLEITTAANFFGRQGFPIGYSVNAITRDSRGRDTIPLQIGQVDAYRNPDVYELDLHVERPFRIGKTLTISPSADCFNVANSHTVLQRIGAVGTYDATGDTPAFTQEPTFYQPVERLSDRTFRAGVRISF